MDGEYTRGVEETQERYEQRVYNFMEKLEGLRIHTIAYYSDYEGIEEETLMELDDMFDEIKADALAIIQGGVKYEE